MRQFDNVFVKRFGYFNVYVIRGNDGDILIDTGFILMKRSLKRWLNQFNIKLIILTHAHVDHIWNVSYIKKLYGCRVCICEDDLINLDNRNIKTYPSSKKYYLWTKLMSLGMKLFVPKKFDIDFFVHDNDIIDEFGLKLKIISLRGHTAGSIGILYKDYLFCGDALVNRWDVEIAFQNQDNDQARESINKIKKIKPKIIFLGHDREITFDKLESF